MNAFQTVHNFVRENLHHHQPLSPFLDEAVLLLNHAHLYYRYIKLDQTIKKSNQNALNGNPVIYGAALHLLSDYTSIGSYAINIALVIKCAKDIFKEYLNLSDAYCAFQQAIRWQYPVYHHVQWKAEKDEALLQFSVDYFLPLHYQITKLANQAMAICRTAWAVLQQLFKLSMSLCDANLLLIGDPQAHYEACTELAANWMEYQTKLQANQQKLCDEIDKNQDLAGRLMTRLGTKNKIGFIIKQLQDALNKSAETGVLQDVYTAATETLSIVYTKGKIAPFHLDLANSDGIVPAEWANATFPPWGGESAEESLNRTCH